MKRKLMMVALDWTRPKDPPMSLGHASILTNAENKNISVIQKSWSVNSDNFQAEDVTQAVMD